MKTLTTILSLYSLLLGGCNASHYANSPSQPASPEAVYVGKVEVYDSKNELALTRKYSYSANEVPPVRDRFNGTRLVEDGKEIARFKIFWPTNNFDNVLPDRSSKNDEIKWTTTMKSERVLTRNSGRYSLGGAEKLQGMQEEEFGYFATNDANAVSIAVDFLVRFAIPNQLQQYRYEETQLSAGRDKKAK